MERDEKEILLNVKTSKEDEKLEKIYLQQIDKITNLEKTMQITLIIFYISIIIFLILLGIKIEIMSRSYPFRESAKISTFYLLIPTLISVISMTIYVNCYLKLKDIFELSQKIDENVNANINSTNSYSLGQFLSYFSVNLISFFVTLYLIILACKLEIRNFNAEYNLISIPLYLTLGILLFYFIFLLPALIHNKYYFLIFLLSTYITCAFIFFVLLNLKLDDNIDNSYIIIFIPLMIPVTLNIIYSITNVAEENEVFYILFLIGRLILVLLCIILIGMTADHKMIIPDSFITLMLLITFACFIDYKVFMDLKEE